MEFSFEFRRLLLLATLLGAFVWLGGFTPPEVRPGGIHQPSAVRKAWSYCVLLFVAGAASVSLVEHTVGHMDPTNLRPVHVLLGVVPMAASVLWLRSLKQAVESPPKAVGVAAVVMLR